MDNPTTAIVDFSALFHRLWHTNHSEAVFKTLEAVRRLDEHRVIIAVDSPPYLRKDIEPSYKANRDVPDPELIGQLRDTIEELANDGYEIASCQGWEADDVIGTLLSSQDGSGNYEDAIVYGADKDLLQVTDIVDPLTGDVKTPDFLGVTREQVIDYLCLVGDTSDNIKGVAGIGPKTAAKMLEKYGTLFNILNEVHCDSECKKFTQKTSDSIMESVPYLDTTKDLITIRTNLDIHMEKRDRKVVEMEPEPESEKSKSIEKVYEPRYVAKVENVDFRRSIEPLGIEQAYRFAQMAYKSGLYPKFKGPEQIMMIAMRGRAFGLDVTTSMDSIEMIQGKPTMKSAMIAGLIMANPACEFLECTNFAQDQSTWETKRVGGRKVISRTFTREEADQAEFSTQPEYAWSNGKKSKTGRTITKDNWIKQPGVMLQWRCVTALARQVYPDIMLGIYGREEFE